MARAKQSKTPERAMGPRRRRSVSSRRTQTRRLRRWPPPSARSAAHSIVSSTCSAEIKSTLRTFSPNRGSWRGWNGRKRPTAGRAGLLPEAAPKRRPQGLLFFFFFFPPPKRKRTRTGAKASFQGSCAQPGEKGSLRQVTGETRARGRTKRVCPS